MRACATGTAVFMGLALAAMTFAACTDNAPPAQPPAPEAAPPAAPASGGPDMQGPTPDPPVKKTPTSAADCKDIQGSSTLVNEPPSNGTPMNNAMTAGDAGVSDRLAPMIEIVKGRRDGFRCCYDLWAKNNRGQSGRIVMTWTLKPDGAVDKVIIDAAKSTLKAPEAEACMVNIAQGILYPPSPSKKQTTFSYPFEFRAH